MNDHHPKLPTEAEAEAQIEEQKRIMGLDHDPFPSGHMGDYMGQLQRQVNDLATLVRSLIWTLNKYVPDHSMTWKAKDYLTRNNLQGSPLRSEEEPPTSIPCTQNRHGVPLVPVMTTINEAESVQKEPAWKSSKRLKSGR